MFPKWIYLWTLPPTFFVCINCIGIYHTKLVLHKKAGGNKSQGGNSKTRLKIHALKSRCYDIISLWYCIENVVRNTLMSISHACMTWYEGMIVTTASLKQCRLFRFIQHSVATLSWKILSPVWTVFLTFARLWQRLSVQAIVHVSLLTSLTPSFISVL